MTDIDAVQAYRTALRSTYVSRDGDECGRTYDLVDEAAADAALAELKAENEALKCCFMCHYYDEGFCLWCATASNGLATPTHPRCTTCRCTPSRWQRREP